ncbi:hypothetical protein [Variovorax sp. N23]|uniref:hypothetical protein n=1 Tax=Variovorax sp. N23 TaxID=2980555 RepID=UPI0021C8BD52|nr:hypothetical protein [Variovorax sp. N23]MCU4117549.1 hypothetical protein [Variovorax sp. N23]
MKASPGARSWIAAGVRHELLTRALPALRHDMAAPVSVMRMGLLMLRRQVAAPTIDMVACEERVALIDHQIAELVSAVRSLRDWELATDDEGITRRGLVVQCVGLMRAAFDLHGVRLQVDEALTVDTDPNAPTWPSGASLRYLMLGALGYLHDTPPDVGAITVVPDGDAALLLRVAARAPATTDPVAGAHRAPRKLAIDAIALQSLAEDLGYVLTIEHDSVRLPLAPG